MHRTAISRYPRSHPVTYTIHRLLAMSAAATTTTTANYLIRPDATRPPTEPLPAHPYTFPLDPFQQHAVLAISKEHNVLVCAKTGSGKTLVGEYQIVHSLAKGKRVFYTTPIKSLSNQKFHDLKTLFPEARVGIMTGDIKFCPDAQIVIMTTEILRNLLYKRGTTTEHLGLTASLTMDDVDAIVFDECHYINDRDRGAVWEETMILLPRDIRMVLLSATLDHPEFLAEWLGQLKEIPIHLLETQHRVVPLTHYVLQKTDSDVPADSFKMITLLDAKENYFDNSYKAWLQARSREEQAEWAHQRAVQSARREDHKGGIEGKVRVSSFVHQLNTALDFLQAKELLPALCFVLSRKQCETYARSVERVLLDVADISAVKHILGFHLHRYDAQLQQNPQYHVIYDLLCRGVAFHHSGLSPLLKEAIEILFSKGYVKLLFCTETFAVGLNMPTKTVLFAGLKKYDDEACDMRLLRNDEYFQMAGRAGRRGKDDKGVVIYLPDQQPIEPREFFQIVKGARTPVTSRMRFHYDFILKSLQSTDTAGAWLRIMDQSYWIRQQQAECATKEAYIRGLEQERAALEIKDPEVKRGCEMRAHYEHLIRTTVNAARKDAQRQLDGIKNKQLGPKWATAWAAYQQIRQLDATLNEQRPILEELQRPHHLITPALQVLYRMGYVSQADPTSREHLTLKGVLATEVNEAHPLLLTELYTAGYLKGLTGTDIVSVLAAFLEHKETHDQVAPAVNDLRVNPVTQDALHALFHTVDEFMSMEVKEEYGCDKDWGMNTYWVEPMTRWVEGTATMTEICTEYGLFEGNFIRAVMKTMNMLDEVSSMATYCQHTEVVDAIMEVKPKMVRDLVISDSLYLRL